VAKTRTVCTEVEVEVVETAATASSSSDQGGDEWGDDWGDAGDWGSADDWGGDKGGGDSGGDSGGGDWGGGKRRLNSILDEQFVRDVDTSLSLKDRLTVQIIAGKSDDEETAAETQAYSWTIESVSQTSLKLKVKFDNP